MAKSKGSQLGSLKSSLRGAGLTGRPQGKKGKSQKKKSSDQLDRQRRQKEKALEEIREKFNPFDVKVTHEKHHVVGRKVKGSQGRPGIRLAGELARQDAYQEDSKKRKKSGGFIDRRFGESNPYLAPEEKMLQRFTRERQKVSRSDQFDLNDQDELTHYGQSLAELDDFNEPDINNSEDDDIDDQVVRQTHFGGFGEGDEPEYAEQDARPKSKAEVMKEIIGKSKMHKHERQQEKQEDLDEIAELDADMDDLQQQLMTSARTRNKIQPNGDMQARGMGDQDDDAQYDALVREMIFERRARPSERTKTEEELAQEEAEALQEAEQQRLRRMRGEPEDDQDTRQSKRAKLTDDLEDDYIPDDDDAQIHGLGRGLDVEGRSDHDSDEGSDDEGVSLSEASAEQAVSAGQHSKSGESGIVGDNLPFTFKCPSTLNEMLAITKEVQIDDYPTIVHRIRTLYHPNLHPENRPRLRVFSKVLFQMIMHLASVTPGHMDVISQLCSHLHAMAKTFPNEVATEFHSHVEVLRNDPEYVNTTISFREIVYFSMVKKIFPTSDLHHFVVTPSMLLMGQYLSFGPLRNLEDMYGKLFVCSLFGKRFCPECMNTLNQCCLAILEGKFGRTVECKGIPWFDDKMDRKASLIGSKRNKSGARSLFQVLGADSSDEFTCVLNLFGKVCGEFVDLYTGYSAFPQAFEPLQKMLPILGECVMHEEEAESIKALSNRLSKVIGFAKREQKPLAVQQHRPIPIKSEVPSFHEKYSVDKRSYDPNRERAESQKLRAQHRDAKKSAIRNLRRDAQFEAREKARQQRESDVAYRSKMSKLENRLKHFDSAV